MRVGPSDPLTPTLRGLRARSAGAPVRPLGPGRGKTGSGLDPDWGQARVQARLQTGSGEVWRGLGRVPLTLARPYGNLRGGQKEGGGGGGF